MTSKTNKLRAVFLTALMIGSVFTAGIAFTGSAAAGTLGNVDVSPGDNTPGATDVSYTVSVEADADLDGSSLTDFDINTNGNSDIDFSDVTTGDISVDISGSAYTGDVDSVVTENGGATLDITLAGNGQGLSEGDTITVDIAGGVDNPTSAGDYEYTVGVSGTSTGSDTVTYGAGDLGDATQGPVEYEALSDDTHYIETIFESGNAGSLAADQVTVYDRSGSEITGAEIEDTGPTVTSGQRLVVDLGNNDLNGEATLEVAGENYTVTTTATTIQQGEANQTAYVGEGIALVDTSTTGQTVTIYEDGDQIRTRGLGEDSYVRVFDTEGLDTDSDYWFEFGTETVDNYNSVNLLDLGFSGAIDPSTAEPTQDITVTAEAGDINRDVLAQVVNDDGDVLNESTGEIGSNGDAQFTVGAPDAEGNYTVEIVDLETGITVEENLTVEAVAGQVSLADSVTEQRGDVVEIPIQLQGVDQASVTVGTDEVNYVANVTVTDAGEDGTEGDGEVTLRWNTYAAGHGDDAFSVVNEDGEADSVTVDDQTELTQRLADGNYDVFAVAGGDNYEEAAQDLSTVYLEQRSTNEMAIWTAPGRIAMEDVTASEDLTERSEINFGEHDDYVVHEVDVPGIFGLLADQDADSTTAAFEDVLGNELDLTIEQTDASTGPNQDAATVDIAESVDNGGLSVVSDAENNTVYVVVDPADAVFDRGAANQDIAVEAGDTFNSTFSVTTDSGLVAGDDDETTSAEFTLVEESTELTYEGDYVNVTNADGQQISGETTLAPGTEFSVRVQSQETPGEGFIRTDESVVVQDDGTFTAELNFSDTAVDSTFGLNVRLTGDTVASGTGQIVESVQQPTDTTEGPTDTTEGPTDTTQEPTDTTEGPTDTTQEPTDTTEAPTDTTEDGTDGGIPGFGMGIALVAVLGAALLALRRDN